MFRIDGMSRTPVYEQIIEQIEKLVSLGIISPGEQLPSVRSLSIELSVNPNTRVSFILFPARGALFPSMLPILSQWQAEERSES